MFDEIAVNRNKKRAANFIANSDFFKFIYKDLADRIRTVDKDIKEILEIGYTESLVHQEFVNLGAYSCFHIIYTLPKNDEFFLDSNKFDLIIFPFGLHYVNDVQKFLSLIKTCLKPNGVFICNFPAAGSFSRLKTFLFCAEEACGGKHSPHILPLIRFEDATLLLQQAGFVESIIDCEAITMEYESPLLLMRWLKNIGESNVLVKRDPYSITKLMYQYLNNFTQESFEDSINLVTLVASPDKGAIKLK